MALPSAPSQLRAWVIWVVGVAAYVYAVMNRTSLSAVGVDAADRFMADASTLSMFAVLQLAVYGAMQVPVGLLLDKHGARPIMTVGIVIMAVGQLAIAFAPNVAVAIGARMLLGFGDAMVFPGVLRLVAVWFPEQRAPLMVQLTGLVGQLGQIIAIVPLAALLNYTTWTVTFGSVAGLGVLFAILVALIVRNHPPDRAADISVNTDTGAIHIVRSAADTTLGIREVWRHPGTRLAFWTHFTTPFAGSAFVLLWGVPFLTVGEGRTLGEASAILILYVVAGMAMGPVMGVLSARFAARRTSAIMLPIVGLQLVVWVAVMVWPGRAPLWMLLILAVVLAMGGPASMIAFDHARAFNSSHRLSTATGIVNSGGFIAALIAILLIGLAMDVQGAGTPETYTLDAFRIAFLTQVPLWLLGATFLLVERKRTRVFLGLDAPRGSRPPRSARR